MNVLTATNAAKAATVVFLAHATGHILAAEATAKRYGISNEKGSNNHVIRRIGFCMLSVCAVSWSLIFRDLSENEAYALATVPAVVEFLGSSLNNEPKKYGFSATANNFSLFYCILLIAGFLSESEKWTPIAILFGLLIWLVYAIGMLFAPRFVATKMWGLQPEAYDADKELLYRVMGILSAQCFVLPLLITLKMNTVRALGYSFAVLTVGLLFLRDQYQIQSRLLVMAFISAGLTYLMVEGELEG